MITMSVERLDNRLVRISLRGHVGAPAKPARLRREDRFPWPGPRRRLLRCALAALVPVPGSPGEYGRLNIYGRPVGRLSGPRGPAATDWRHRSSADDIDARFALRVEQDGTIRLFDEATAPWLSRRLERAHARRVALVLGWRKPARSDLNRMAYERRGAWAVLDGGAVKPGISTASLAVIRGTGGVR